MEKKDRGISLVELLMSISIFGLIVIAMFALSAYSYTNMISAGRRAVLQQECSLVIDHVSKYFGEAIGLSVGNAQDCYREDNPNRRWKVRYDKDRDGLPDDDCSDCWHGYRYYPNPNNNRVVYFKTQGGNGWGVSTGTQENLVYEKITNFDIDFYPFKNYFYVTVTARNNPAVAAGPTNPEVTMDAFVSMPMVSAR